MHMHTGDLVNGAFELVGGLMNLMNVRRLYRDKVVKGVSPFPTAFFTAWGFWNLFYYPSLDQWASFFGGMVIVSANLAWVLMALHYTRRNR